MIEEIQIEINHHLEYLQVGNELRGDLKQKARKDKLILVALLSGLGATLSYIGLVPIGIAMIGIAFVVIFTYDNLMMKRHHNYYRKELEASYGDSPYTITYTFLKKYLEYKDATQSGKLFYDKIGKATLSENLLLLWTSPHHAMILPREQLTNEEAVLEYLSSNQVNIQAI